MPLREASRTSGHFTPESPGGESFLLACVAQPKFPTDTGWLIGAVLGRHRAVQSLSCMALASTVPPRPRPSRRFVLSRFHNYKCETWGPGAGAMHAFQSCGGAALSVVVRRIALSALHQRRSPKPFAAEKRAARNPVS